MGSFQIGAANSTELKKRPQEKQGESAQSSQYTRRLIASLIRRHSSRSDNLHRRHSMCRLGNIALLPMPSCI
jgi:hypothetical protein